MILTDFIVFVCVKFWERKVESIESDMDILNLSFDEEIFSLPIKNKDFNNIVDCFCFFGIEDNINYTGLFRAYNEVLRLIIDCIIPPLIIWLIIIFII